jgi:predicted SnoaL-like aldol condensation-catalyzing enzyme
MLTTIHFINIATAMFTVFTMLSGCNSTPIKSDNLKVNIPMKEIAMKAQNAFFKDYNATEVKQYFREDYIQHNPWVATGRAPFIAAFSRVVEKRPATRKTVNNRVITSGDYVVLHVHAFDTSRKGPGSAGVDTFRVENGKIMEHWDVWQKIPEKMPHDNGMILLIQGGNFPSILKPTIEQSIILLLIDQNPPKCPIKTP